jgi:hypothetical protein
MIRGIFDLDTHTDIVFGPDVVTILDAGYSLLGHYTEVLYGMVLENQW